MALTDTAIRKIKSTEKSFKITDSLGPNLLLKPNGSKLWYMKYRIDGKEKRLEASLRYYLAQGLSRKEALAMVAMDLGHGDERERYVAQVYSQF
ncbi:Arm DNA-binding domain-containing protein [Salmonella enterica]|uniref:Arm DNA-binding domain-containing protein n=1 Tax=Salmonella enterica TaxID=28901 RepID=UPI002948C19C|nr:Arm DNA-binding domain-containing protein [Salmonella enterica]